MIRRLYVWNKCKRPQRHLSKKNRTTTAKRTNAEKCRLENRAIGKMRVKTRSPGGDRDATRPPPTIPNWRSRISAAVKTTWTSSGGIPTKRWGCMWGGRFRRPASRRNPRCHWGRRCKMPEDRFSWGKRAGVSWSFGLVLLNGKS